MLNLCISMYQSVNTSKYIYVSTAEQRIFGSPFCDSLFPFHYMLFRCTYFLQFFDFILQLPLKRCLIISHSQKIFQICSKFDHKLVRWFIILVQAVWNSAAGRTRIGLTSLYHNLEENINMFYDWVIFWHLFRESSKMKLKNGKNKKYL